MNKPETPKLPAVESLVMEFSQEEDTATTRDGQPVQVLRVEVCASLGVAETGYFAISTDRWAIDDVEDFIAILRHVAKAAGMVQP